MSDIEGASVERCHKEKQDELVDVGVLTPKKKNRRKTKPKKRTQAENGPPLGLDQVDNNALPLSQLNFINSFPPDFLSKLEQLGIAKNQNISNLELSDLSSDDSSECDINDTRSSKQSKHRDASNLKYLKQKSLKDGLSKIKISKNKSGKTKETRENSIDNSGFTQFKVSTRKSPNDALTAKNSDVYLPQAQTSNNAFFTKKQTFSKKNKNVITQEDNNRSIESRSTTTKPKAISSSSIKSKPKEKKTKSEDPNKKNKYKNTVVNNRLSEYKFRDYISEDQLSEGLKSNELIKGAIRINQRNFREAYVPNPNRSEQDIFIDEVLNRNRALEGDIVAVELNPESEWRPNGQKTGKVVYIIQKNHPRTCIGILKLTPDRSRKFAQFLPRDSRMPRLRVPFTDWPVLFYEQSEEYEKTLFLAKITEWDDVRFSLGTIIENVGQCGDLKNETTALLLENCLDVTPFAPEMNNYFPKLGSEIPIEEISKRKDLRKECIFTIDPLTARDLDDALSCKKLPNGHLEIGVHISDVSYYLAENTPLDNLVSKRATSIYLVENVYHMLPKDLCMLCSLLPGEDKLAFSVFWEMTEEGEILDSYCTRTVINSCVQLAYEHAQLMIENPNRKFDLSELPEIHNGFTPEDLSSTVNALNRIALNLRKDRFDGGALRIDNLKLAFRLNKLTGLPEEYFVYENKASHRMIEEFMLLANITVATRLKEVFPDLAFLRRHATPYSHMMLNLKVMLEKIGIHLDITSAGSLQKSLLKYSGDDKLCRARMAVINALCSKPMPRAEYFCAGDLKKHGEYWHYALNVPLYTHFTSPIRRYADIMVHRLLASSLGYSPEPNWLIDTVGDIAANCNKMKYNAKKAGEQSIDLYLLKYIAQNQPLTEQAVVIDVKDKSFDACVLSMGITVRIYTNDDKLSPAHITLSKLEGIAALTVFWPPHSLNFKPCHQIIEIFAIVTVELNVTTGPQPKIEATLLRPA